MRTILLFFFLFVNLFSWGQNDTLAEHEITGKIQFVVTAIPIEQYPMGATELIALIEEDGSAISFAWKYINEIVVYRDAGTWTAEGMEVPFINTAKMLESPFMRNDTIYFSFEMPFRATVYSVWFTLKNEKVKFDGSNFNDPSAENIEKAEAALEKGDIAKAVMFYSSVMYPSAYMSEGLVAREIMTKAHSMALELFKSGETKHACELMHQALEFYGNNIYLDLKSPAELKEATAENGSNAWNEKDFKTWIGDYGLFLYRSKDLDASEIINKYLTTVLPEVAGPYLQLGDTYYEKKEIAKAKSTYSTYKSLMVRQGKKSSIPKRVEGRISEK